MWTLSKVLLARPVAQLVERWTPGSESPSSNFEMLRRLIYETPGWDGPVGGSSCDQLKSVEWDGPCLANGFDGHDKLSLINSPNNPELPDWTVGARASATSTA